MEPFRATRLWNGLIKEFRNGIYPKRHRWRMRYYDNCFTSSEAIEFLLIHLHNDPSFGPWVTRDQALRLLTKFIENHVIVEVKSSSSKGPFEDDGRLYRMCPFSPIKKLRSALNSRTNLRELAEASPKKRPKSSVKPKKIVSTPPTSSLSVPFSKPALNEVKEQEFVRRSSARLRVNEQQEFVRRSSARLRVNEQQEFVRRPSARLKSCKVIPRSIGKIEYQEVWKSSALTRLQRITGVSTIEDFVRVDEIQACDIIQNNLKISHNKIVIIEDKSQDLPHWVLSAMRCLAHWPDRADETVLPSYPGFERDVFKTVSNYFHSQPEPLLTYNLYDIITGSFLICDRRDRGLDDSPSDLTTPPSVTATNRLNSFGSVENLMLDMTMGWTPLTKFTGQSSEDVNRGGFERRSVNRQPYVTPVNTKSRNQSLTSGKGNDCYSGTIFCLTSQKIMSPGELSLNEVPSQNQNESYVSEMSKNEHNQESHPQSVSPEGYSNIYTQDEPATYLQPSNIIDDYGFLPAQYFSPAKKTSEHSKRYSSDSDLMNCRSFLDNSKHSLKSDQPVNDERPLNELHYASTSCLETKDSSLSSEECSFEFSRTRSGSFRNRRKFSSLTNIDIKPTANDDKRKRTSKNNLGISKKFGSASEIFQKIFTKKTERTKSKWSVHEPKLNEKSMSFNSNVKLQQWNLAERSTERHVLEGCRRQTSPPYPSPIRATLSQPVLVGKRNDSSTSLNSFQSKHNESNTSVGKQNTSSPSLGQQANVQKCYVSGSNLDSFNPVLTCKQNYSGSSLNCLRPAFASQHTHSGTHSDPSLNSLKPAFASKRTHSGSSLNSLKGLKCNKSGTSLDSFHSAKSNLTRQTSSSSSMKWSTPEEDKHSLSSTSLCLTDDQSYTIEGLKMCCLLLPSPNRKKLHLLLKLMAKMVNNKQLNLSKQMSTKSLVLQTFWRCILSCEVEVGLDEILAIKVVTYMMEHYDQIMTVSEELKSDVQERMLYLRRSQVKYNGTEDVENIPVTFCQQISTDEYREQKLSYSENAISMLLEDIINSKTMAIKVKRKKLKKFQQEYPDIYAKRLPTTSHEAELFPQKPKIKQPMLNMKRSLTKLKSLR